jgi:hypothetical protein
MLRGRLCCPTANSAEISIALAASRLPVSGPVGGRHRSAAITKRVFAEKSSPARDVGAGRCTDSYAGGWLLCHAACAGNGSSFPVWTGIRFLGEWSWFLPGSDMDFLACDGFGYLGLGFIALVLTVMALGICRVRATGAGDGVRIAPISTCVVLIFVCSTLLAYSLGNKVYFSQHLLFFVDEAHLAGSHLWSISCIGAHDVACMVSNSAGRFLSFAEELAVPASSLSGRHGAGTAAGGSIKSFRRHQDLSLKNLGLKNRTWYCATIRQRGTSLPNITSIWFICSQARYLPN